VGFDPDPGERKDRDRPRKGRKIRDVRQVLEANVDIWLFY